MHQSAYLPCQNRLMVTHLPPGCEMDSQKPMSIDSRSLACYALCSAMTMVNHHEQASVKALPIKTNNFINQVIKLTNQKLKNCKSSVPALRARLSISGVSAAKSTGSPIKTNPSAGDGGYHHGATTVATLQGSQGFRAPIEAATQL